MKNLFIILSLLIVTLVGCSESENDNIIDNVEEINKGKHLYYYDVNPIEFLGVWELKKDSTIRTPSSKFNKPLWDSHPIPKKLEFKIDTTYIANTTLTIYTYNDVILKTYWRLQGYFIEASTYEPDKHPIWGMFHSKNYFLAVVTYDDNNMIIHFYRGGFHQLEYEKTIDYDIDENIFELTKR